MPAAAPVTTASLPARLGRAQSDPRASSSPSARVLSTRRPSCPTAPTPLLESWRGHTAHRHLRLRRRRPDRPPRMPCHAAARGLPLPRGRSALPVRSEVARRDPPLCPRDRLVSGGCGRQADRRGLQLRDRRSAATAPGEAPGPRDRRPRPRGPRGGASHQEPPDRRPRHRGHRRERPLRGGRACARRGRPRHLHRVPSARAPDRVRCAERGDRRGRARVRPAAEGRERWTPSSSAAPTTR